MRDSCKYDKRRSIILFHDKTMKSRTIFSIIIALLLLASCNDADEVAEEERTPRLCGMTFRVADNPRELVEGATCSIFGDSIVECWVRYIMDEKRLIPHLDFEGDGVFVEGMELVSDMTKLDFSKPVSMVVRSGSLEKAYTVYVHAFTGLPILWIETEDREDITSKDEYLNARFRIVEDVCTRAAGDVKEFEGRIRGRGNTSWDRAAKKSYKLKFDQREALLDEPEDESWVLLANYFDKTQLRNATALYMGSISRLDYTPRYHFVEVMLNGRYNGTYQLCEKLKISVDCVDVGEDGFLLEIDAKAETTDVTFKTSHIGNPVNIKEPDVTADDEDYAYVKDFVTEAERTLYADHFTDPQSGWQKYLDMDSFVDWYLINEIAKNNDAVFFSSCYMNLRRGGKLKMGPLWDFDIAFGNVNYNENYDVEGFWVQRAGWYHRLFQDPAFVARVKERLAFFCDHEDDIMNEINANVDYLSFSVIENNNRWGTLYTYTWPNNDIWGNYQNEVQYLKGWLHRRLEWMRNEIGNR